MYSLPTDLYGEVEILDDGKIKVSQGVQVPSEDDDVLIKSTREELMSRIKAFTQFKRKQLDISNQLEFIRHQNSSEDSCARVDAVYMGGANQRHITKRQVINTEGPSSHLPTLKEQLWAELVLEGRAFHRPEVNSQHVLMIEERIEDLEDTIDSKGSSQMSLLARVKRLELKVLAMKGHSGEYEHMYNTKGND